MSQLSGYLVENNIKVNVINLLMELVQHHKAVMKVNINRQGTFYLSSNYQNIMSKKQALLFDRFL